MDTAVGLVKAYLELSGYFVLTELPVRAGSGRMYHDVTDLDIIAVRFPHPPRHAATSRPLDVFLEADPALDVSDGAVDVVIAEVKEGHAQVNPPLRRLETIAFALRRIGCCPEDAVEGEAEMVAYAGTRELAMPGYTRCRVRLLLFAGYGTGPEYGMRTILLSRCDEFIAQRLRDAGDVLTGVYFKDPVLGLYALQEKVAGHVLAELRLDAP